MALEKLQFKCSHRVKMLTTAPVVDGKGVRLPKLKVPTFDGDVCTTLGPFLGTV